MKIFTAYDPPPGVFTDCSKDKVLVKQSEYAATDVNLIVAQYSKTGILPGDASRILYADVSEMGDYREAVEQVRLADSLFMAQPAEVRRFFDNDPASFLDYCSDPANRDGMIELGLLEKPPAEPQAAVAPAAQAGGAV